MHSEEPEGQATIYKFYSLFKDGKGIERIIKMITTERFDTFNNDNKHFLYPIKVIQSFILPFKSLYANTRSNEFRGRIEKEFITPVAKSFETRFRKVINEDFEEINDNFMDCLKFLFSVSRMSLDHITAKLTDCANYLHSPSLEFKLKGIKLLINEINLPELIVQEKHILNTKSKNAIIAKERLQQVNIIDIIFKDSLDKDLISNSFSIVQFLVLMDALPKDFSYLVLASYRSTASP